MCEQKEQAFLKIKSITRARWCWEHLCSQKQLQQPLEGENLPQSTRRSTHAHTGTHTRPTDGKAALVSTINSSEWGSNMNYKHREVGIRRNLGTSPATPVYREEVK
jgi:hypothetical protein